VSKAFIPLYKGRFEVVPISGHNIHITDSKTGKTQIVHIDRTKSIPSSIAVPGPRIIPVKGILLPPGCTPHAHPLTDPTTGAAVHSDDNLPLHTNLLDDNYDLLIDLHPRVPLPLSQDPTDDNSGPLLTSEDQPPATPTEPVRTYPLRNRGIHITNPQLWEGR
jgi:hypothetical protein